MSRNVKDRLELLTRIAEHEERWTAKEIIEAAIVHIDELERIVQALCDAEWDYPSDAEEVLEDLAVHARKAMDWSS